jgi:soluble lytic murein transglycosylase-like protein/tetratricopeptide (TPR) repeat protein
MDSVKLRHSSLVILCAAAMALPACQKSISSLNFDYSANRADPISKAIADNAWEKVEKLSATEADPLIKLIHLRALYELKKYDQLLASPVIVDQRFNSYDLFLRTLSAFEASKFDQVVSYSIPEDLPRPLQERLTMFHGEAFQELDAPDKAEATYEKFLNEFKRSPFRGDVLIRLADISLALGKNAQAEKYYEELYEFFPLTDSDDVARQRLIDAGRFSQIDTDAHLTRIHQLRKASHFDRAYREVLNLLKAAPKSRKPRLELALAQINFGQRNYRDCEKLAKKALKSKLPEDLEVEWRQILASSYIRLSQFEKGEKEYRLLLDQKIPPTVRERILYRLGLSALDQFDYDTATFYFDRLRNQFSKGNYLESAHWFGALTIYLAEKDKPTPDLARIQEAQLLLDTLIDLPHGIHFASQAIYFKTLLANLAQQPELAQTTTLDLQKNFSLAFHTQLLDPAPYRFLNVGRLLPPKEPPPTTDASIVTFKSNLSWTRLEFFRSVNLKTWGSMELDQFLDANQAGDDRLSLAVAERLESVEDWANLVRWAERNLSRTMKNLDPKDPTLRFHYPRAYESEVRQQAEAFNISPFLIWGIMREESRYRSDVISAAGAIGLMQVMPSLGNRIGMILKDPQNKRMLLTDAARNIRYGTYHLAELRNEVEKLPIGAEFKPILQVAAYNAGIEPVGRWIKQKDMSRLDLFVESIPFQETRQYVKRVLQTAYIYYRLYGDAGQESLNASDRRDYEKK